MMFAPGRIALVVHSIAGALGLVFALALPAGAEPDYPAFSAPVVDAANVLPAADKADITRKLLDLQERTGVQFAVATVPSLGGEEIEPYANELFRQWKLGQKGVNNGLLLVLAPNERKLRFEVGYGLEGSFTDLQSKLIQHNTMVPKLKAGDPAGALKAGVDDAITVLTSDKAALPERLKQPANAGQPGNGFVLFFFAFILFIVIAGMIQRRRGASSGWWLPGAIIGSGGGSGWSSSDSSSGDSFSGGGGGDSGGGGSSDSY